MDLKTIQLIIIIILSVISIINIIKYQIVSEENRALHKFIEELQKDLNREKWINSKK